MKKADVLKRVRKNLDRHKQIVAEAVEGYRKAAIAELEKHLKRIKNGKRARIYVSLTEPMDMTREYLRVVEMLESTEEDTITLNESDFQHFIMDDWEWRHQFTSQNAQYSAMARAAADE